MSAHLTDQDCLNALATLYGEFYKQQDDPQRAIDRAYYHAPTTHKLENFECETIARLLLHEASQTHKGLALHKVVFDHLLEANINSLKYLYPRDTDAIPTERIWYNNYEFKKSSTVTKWVAEKDPKGLLQLWGMLKGWEYQSCEDPTWQDDAVYQMKYQIQYAILNLLEDKFCGEDNVWTRWVDPKLDNHIVNISDMFATR
mgnify:FL=1